MATTDNNSVVCAFCGEPLTEREAVTLVVNLGQEATQTLFAHAEHLRAHLHPSIPLHPDILDAAAKQVPS